MEIPNWLSDIVKKFKCPLCEADMRDKDIISFGWRVNEKDPNKDFFVDYVCEKCEKKIFIPLSSIDLEKFAMQVLDESIREDLKEEDKLNEDADQYDEDGFSQYDSGEPTSYKKADPDAPKARKRILKSKIKDDEVTKFIKAMNNFENFEEFLKNIGLTEDDIKNYNKNYNKKDIKDK